MASGLIPGTPVGQLFSRSSQPTTPTLQDIQGGVSSGHAIPQLHPENSQESPAFNLQITHGVGEIGPIRLSLHRAERRANS